jgi:hypothetical protein
MNARLASAIARTSGKTRRICLTAARSAGQLSFPPRDALYIRAGCGLLMSTEQLAASEAVLRSRGGEIFRLAYARWLRGQALRAGYCRRRLHPAR